MIKVGEWVLTTGGKVVFNEKDGRYSFKNKKDAMEAVCGRKVESHKLQPGQYFIWAKQSHYEGIEYYELKSYTLTKVTESNLNRVMSMLEDN